MCLPLRRAEAQCVLPQLPARQQEPSVLAAPGDRNPQEFPRPHLSEPSWGSRRPSSKPRLPSAHFAQQPKQTNTRHRCSSDSREIIDLQVAFLALLDAYALAKFIANIYSQLCCGLFVIFFYFIIFSQTCARWCCPGQCGAPTARTEAAAPAPKTVLQESLLTETSANHPKAHSRCLL